MKRSVQLKLGLFSLLIWILVSWGAGGHIHIESSLHTAHSCALCLALSHFSAATPFPVVAAAMVWVLIWLYYFRNSIFIGQFQSVSQARSPPCLASL